MDKYMQLNLPTGHQGLNDEQILQLQEVYDKIAKSMDREYDREADAEIRRYENCKTIITGLNNLLRGTNILDKDYKPIIRNINSRTREMEHHCYRIYGIYLNEAFKREKIQELFQLTGLYEKYVKDA